MEDTSPLRQAVLAWLEQARDLPSIPQAITDVALSTQPEFDAVINAVAGAAPKSEHRCCTLSMRVERLSEAVPGAGHTGRMAAVRTC